MHRREFDANPDSRKISLFSVCARFIDRNKSTHPVQIKRIECLKISILADRITIL